MEVSHEEIHKLQYLESQLEALRQQMVGLEATLVELERVKYALESIQALSSESESYLPLGAGVYTKGRVSKPENLLVDIGTGVIVEKPPEEVQELLEKKQEETEKTLEESQRMEAAIEKQYSEIAKRLQEVKM